MPKNLDLDHLRRHCGCRPTLRTAHAMVVLRALQRYNGQTPEALRTHEHMTRSQLARAVRMARDILSPTQWCMSCFRSPVMGSAWEYWLEQW